MNIDLFHQGTVVSSIRKIKSDIADWIDRPVKELKILSVPEHIKKDINKAKIPLVCIMDSHLTTGKAGTAEADLSDIMIKFGITEYAVIPIYPVSPKSLNRGTVKEYAPFIIKLVDILVPSVIVLAGEMPSFVFLNRKPKLEDNHGKIVANYSGINVFMTHPPGYYSAAAKFEDDAYKQHLMSTDWTIIKKEYDRYVI